MYVCEKCERRTVATKWGSVISAPHHLLVMVNCLNWNSNNRSKVHVDAEMKIGGFSYSVYAAVMREGDSGESGHYYTVGGLAETPWAPTIIDECRLGFRSRFPEEQQSSQKGYILNDSTVTRLANKEKKSLCEQISAHIDDSRGSPYIVFYR